MSGRNGMVCGVGRAVTIIIGIRKSFALALAQRSPTSLAKKTLSLNFATSCHPVFININIFSYLVHKKLSKFCSVFFNNSSVPSRSQ